MAGFWAQEDCTSRPHALKRMSLTLCPLPAVFPLEGKGWQDTVLAKHLQTIQHLKVSKNPGSGWLETLQLTLKSMCFRKEIGSIWF